MTNEPPPAPEAVPKSARPRRVSRWVLMGVLGLAILVSAWRLLFFNVWEGGTQAVATSMTRSDGKPHFVETTYPTYGLPANPGVRQRIFVAYLNFRARHGKRNPTTYSFPSTPVQSCSIHGLLNQCMDVTGTRYLMANEVAAGSVRFGHSNVLNGAQWVAAFEAALQTNHPDWYDFATKRMCQENLLIIREQAGVVKIVPPSKLADYQKAGLISSSYIPENNPTNPVSTP